MDLRHTGKDLVQNHMTFCLFNHIALFPEEQWPRGFGIIGHLALGGKKMSKSKGDVWYLRDAMKAFGADLLRVRPAHAGDRPDHPRLHADLAEAIGGRVRGWLRLL